MRPGRIYRTARRIRRNVAWFAVWQGHIPWTRRVHWRARLVRTWASSDTAIGIPISISRSVSIPYVIRRVSISSPGVFRSPRGTLTRVAAGGRKFHDFCIVWPQSRGGFSRRASGFGRCFADR